MLKFEDVRAITYRDTSVLNDALTFGTPCRSSFFGFLKPRTPKTRFFCLKTNYNHLFWYIKETKKGNSHKFLLVSPDNVFF